ncbi:MAG: hypothetical protein F6J92_34925 [Symploca sp. SIO1A3]|nr:hypothetical protein [Symploca sp. SIO1A3]
MKPVDLTQWTVETYTQEAIHAQKYVSKYPGRGIQAQPNWEVLTDGNSVEQLEDSLPTFFYSDFNALGHTISVKVYAEPSKHNNFIGFALNFQPGDTGNQDADFLLLHWEARSDHSYGLKLSSVKGIPSFLGFFRLPELAKGKTLGSSKWEHEKDYEFKFALSKSKLQIWVNSSLEFELDGNFSDGRFALFDCAQEKIDFKEIQADLKEDVSPSWEKLSQTKLQPSDLQRNDQFGISVAISGEMAIVGAQYADLPSKPGAGAAYIFKLAGGTWQLQQKLQPSDLQRNDNFGHSVAISGDVAIVGAYLADAPGKPNAGAAYIFKLEGGTWQQQKLQPPDLQQGEQFGISVAISGEVAIVGARFADAPGKTDAGVAYIFKLEGGTWQQQQKLQPSDLQGYDHFGVSVAISEEVAIVGAWLADAPGKPDAGVAYIFKLAGGTWQQQQKLQPSDLQRNDNFGISVAISGEVAIVGAFQADAPGKPDAGVAYIFKWEGGTWQQQQKLQPPDLQRNDNFGRSVAISGEVAIVGAHSTDAPGIVDTGAAYIFKLAGGTWQQQQKLQPPDLQRNDNFGISVAISKELAIVGAWQADAPGIVDAGAVYIFQSED